nr:hypothetical protein [Belliella filtrata]
MQSGLGNDYQRKQLEWAARGGIDKAKYPWGNAPVSEMTHRANY